MLVRGTDRCNGIEPLGCRSGFTLMWALIDNVFYGDERAEVIAEVVAEAFGSEPANRLEATHRRNISRSGAACFARPTWACPRFPACQTGIRARDRTT
jgi:hypothetical protein